MISSESALASKELSVHSSTEEEIGVRMFDWRKVIGMVVREDSWILLF